MKQHITPFLYISFARALVNLFSILGLSTEVHKGRLTKRREKRITAPTPSTAHPLCTLAYKFVTVVDHSQFLLRERCSEISSQ